MKTVKLSTQIWFFTVLITVLLFCLDQLVETSQTVDSREFGLTLFLVTIFAFGFTMPLVGLTGLCVYLVCRLPVSVAKAANLLFFLLASLIVGFFFLLLPCFIGKEFASETTSNFLVITLLSLTIVFPFSINGLKELKDTPLNNIV